MQEKGLTINELIIRVQEAMKEGGYSISAVYARYGHWFNVISTYYRKTGRIYYEPDVTAEFIALQAERKERSEISDHYLRHLRYAAHRLDEYFMTEKIRIINVMHGTRFGSSRAFSYSYIGRTPQISKREHIYRVFRAGEHDSMFFR